jgi:hypothetical protein
MRRFLALLAALAVPGAAVLPTAGCSNQAGPSDASADGTIVLPGPDSGNDEAESDGASALFSTMRLANMSPDLGAVDFCWRVYGASTFTGPVIMGSLDAGAPGPGTPDAAEGGGAGEAGADTSAGDDELEGGPGNASDGSEIGEGGDGGPAEAEADGSPGDAASDASDSAEDEGASAPGEAGAVVQVSFGAMTGLVQLPAIGTLDIALVSPNQLSCESPAYVGQVTLDPGKTATVVVMGLRGVDAGGESSLVLRSFTDEPADPTTARVRLVHAALGWPHGNGPAPPLSVQAGSSVLANEIDPGQIAMTSTSPGVDALGYAVAPAFSSPAPVELFTIGDAAPRTWSTPFFPVGLLPGVSVTAFIVSGTQGTLGVVWCGGAQSGELPGSCMLQPAR